MFKGIIKMLNGSASSMVVFVGADTLDALFTITWI